jgi:hypothetical protein
MTLISHYLFKVHEKYFLKELNIKNTLIFKNFRASQQSLVLHCLGLLAYIYTSINITVVLSFYVFGKPSLTHTGIS